jgi:hypothetical protein
LFEKQRNDEHYERIDCDSVNQSLECAMTGKEITTIDDRESATVGDCTWSGGILE